MIKIADCKIARVYERETGEAVFFINYYRNKIKDFGFRCPICQNYFVLDSKFEGEEYEDVMNMIRTQSLLCCFCKKDDNVRREMYSSLYEMLNILGCRTNHPTKVRRYYIFKQLTKYLHLRDKYNEYFYEEK